MEIYIFISKGINLQDLFGFLINSSITSSLPWYFHAKPVLANYLNYSLQGTVYHTIYKYPFYRKEEVEKVGSWCLPL